MYVGDAGCVYIAPLRKRGGDDTKKLAPFENSTKRTFHSRPVCAEQGTSKMT